MKQVIAIGCNGLNGLVLVVSEEVVGDVLYAVFVVSRTSFFRLFSDCLHQILSSVIFNRIFSLKIFAQNLNRFMTSLIHYAPFGFSLTNCCCYETRAETVSREIERQTCYRSCSLNDEPDALRSKTLICNLTASQNSSEQCAAGDVANGKPVFE